MSAEDISLALKTASDVAQLASAAPGPAGIAATIVAIALKAGSALALAGKDPVIEIERILSADPEMAKVHDGWDSFIMNELPPVPAPVKSHVATIPPPPDTQPSSGVSGGDYEDD